MTHEDDLAVLAHHQHVRHWARLCREDNPNRHTRDAWRAKVAAMARGHHFADVKTMVQPRPSVVEAGRLLQAMRACRYRSSGTTGCGCGHCGLRSGAPVNHLDCFACLQRYGAE